jgi:hypothetical protein
LKSPGVDFDSISDFHLQRCQPELAMVGPIDSLRKKSERRNDQGRAHFAVCGHVADDGGDGLDRLCGVSY